MKEQVLKLYFFEHIVFRIFEFRTNYVLYIILMKAIPKTQEQGERNEPVYIRVDTTIIQRSFKMTLTHSKLTEHTLCDISQDLKNAIKLLVCF